MTVDKDFALLIGKAFLREVERGNTQSATAFGRAFLLSLGMKGPADHKKSEVPNGKVCANDLIAAEN